MRLKQGYGQGCKGGGKVSTNNDGNGVKMPKIHLPLALACEGVEDVGTALKIHLQLAVACERGGGGTDTHVRW